MTLGELTDTAIAAYVKNKGHTAVMGWRDAVLAVLDAVERECVPEKYLYPEFEDSGSVGYNNAIEDVLERINALRGNYADQR